MNRTGLLKPIFLLLVCLLCISVFSGCVKDPSGDGSGKTGPAAQETQAPSSPDQPENSAPATGADTSHASPSTGKIPGQGDAGEEDIFPSSDIG